VNIDEEETKSGILLQDLAETARSVAEMPNLTLRGLMCIPKADQSDESLGSTFMKMKSAFDELADSYPDVDTLSMGMSGDIEKAIECGSTMVRVGTALFGERSA
jgi:pyridoxal phosphate enzyme (YggS family)